MALKGNLLVVIIALSVVVVLLFLTPENPAGIFLRNIVLPQGTLTRDEAWNVFDQYISYATNADLTGLKSVSYQLGPVCSDPTRFEECEGIMRAVASLASNYRKENLTQVLADEKQIILTSEWQFHDHPLGREIWREEIYVVRDTAGQPKILYIELPFRGVLEVRDLPNDQIDAQLKQRVVDNDQDGLDDEIENCLDTQLVSCVGTDSTKRDTDADGWWDGIEVHFR